MITNHFWACSILDWFRVGKFQRVLCASPARERQTPLWTKNGVSGNWNGVGRQGGAIGENATPSDWVDLDSQLGLRLQLRKDFLFLRERSILGVKPFKREAEFSSMCRS